MARRSSCCLLAGAVLFAAPAARAHTGFGMTVDHQGRVVFLDSARARVMRIEPDGTLTVLANDKHADNLVQDATGNLYLQHMNQTLWRMAADGSICELPMPPTAAPAGAIANLGELVAVDREGRLYLAGGNEFYQGSSKLLRWSADHGLELLAGSQPGHADGTREAARLRHIRSAAWQPDGSLVLVDGTCVRRVTEAGQVTTLCGRDDAGPDPGALENGPWFRAGDDAHLGWLLGIATCANGDVVVADSEHFRVCRISPEGNWTAIHRTSSPWKPVGVAASGDHIYIMERMFIPLPMGLANWFATHRIKRLAADGTITTLATIGGGGGLVLAALLVLLVAFLFLRRRRRQSVNTVRGTNVPDSPVRG